jgi:CHASE3 domain sensor protein
MNMQEIGSLISTLGFPIVASGALFWLNIKTSETFAKSIEEMRKTIDENSKIVSELLNNLKK